MRILKNVVRDSFRLDNDLSFPEKLRVELIAVSTTIGFVLSIIYETCMLLFAPFSLVIHINNFLWILTFGGGAFLNLQKQYKAAKYYYLLATLFTVSVYQFCFGSVLELEVVYLAIIVTAHYVFDDKDKLTTVLLTLLTHTIISIYQFYYPAPYSHLLFPFFHTTYFGFAIILLASQSYKVLEEYDSYRDTTLQQKEDYKINNEQLKRFNYIMMNDIYTPLRKIIASSQSLSSNNTQEEKEKYINSISNNSIQLSETINNIGDIQSINTKEMVVEQIKLNEMIKNVTSASENFLKQKEISITADRFSHIYSYQYPLFIVLKNLIKHIITSQNIRQNTIHFSNLNITPQGAVKIQLGIKNNDKETSQYTTETLTTLGESIEEKLVAETLYGILKGQLYKNNTSSNTLNYTIILPQTLL